MPVLRKSPKKLNIIVELLVVSLAVALAMTFVIQTQPSHASRADGVSGGVGSSKPCPVIVGTTPSGGTIYQPYCRTN